MSHKLPANTGDILAMFLGSLVILVMAWLITSHWLLTSKDPTITDHASGTLSSTGYLDTDPNIPDLSQEWIDPCEKEDLNSRNAKYFPGSNNCQKSKIDLYKTLTIFSDAITPDSLTSADIISRSKIFTVSGAIEDIRMYISAWVKDKQYSVGRKNAVYFYINSSDKWGLLNANRINQFSSEVGNLLSVKNKNDNQPWVFLSEQEPLTLVYDMKDSISISQRRGLVWSRRVNYFDIFTRINRDNYIYAYVTKPTFWIINELTFAYLCKKDQECSIEVK